MSSYFAYTRVSTARQGQLSVSLAEQRAAIEQFASSHNVIIAEWFEEVETAARTGRKVFRDLVTRLSLREADGLIIHKIDRSARNLRDWADIGDLIDRGIDVRFAHDDLRLDSRGGRLAADIQAVIAADYIRNLREEVRKGILGRLRQGFYPLPAPVGYLDRGAARAKIPDPQQAPLVIEAFKRYATDDRPLRRLCREISALGLINRRGHKLTVSNLSSILRNPFYAGTISIKCGTFSGVHEPLISRLLFDRVQEVLKGRKAGWRLRHHFGYSRLIQCACGWHLVGETHKGHVYYQCARCRGKMIREEKLDATFAASLPPLDLEPEVAHTMTMAQKVRLVLARCDYRDRQITTEWRMPASGHPAEELTSIA